MKLSTIAAAFTVLITSSYAAEEIIESFVLFGTQDSTGTTPNYTQSIVVGSVPIHITNPLVVKSINSTVLPQHYNCTFVGADGVNTTLGGTAEVNPPQAQVSLFCSSQYVP
ncbi:hypothetical protein BDR22DRAFT_884707 [Usnea florida]